MPQGKIIILLFFSKISASREVCHFDLICISFALHLHHLHQQQRPGWFFTLTWIDLDVGGWWSWMVGRILLSASGHLNARIAKLALNRKKANRWKLIS